MKIKTKKTSKNTKKEPGVGYYMGYGGEDGLLWLQLLFSKTVVHLGCILDNR